LYEKLIGEPFSPAEIADQETYDKVVVALNALP